MAKSYRRSDQPPIAPFETILAPAGALSATADDMSRFLRALMNGGELDGVRILPKARLDEMMAPQSSSPAGYLGLVFIGKKIAGRDAIWHEWRDDGVLQRPRNFSRQTASESSCRAMASARSRPGGKYPISRPRSRGAS